VSSLVCRHDEQAAHVASVTEQFGNTQQALQELQAELQVLHTAQHSEVVKLTERLSGAGNSIQDLQVSPFAIRPMFPGILIALVCCQWDVT
jgi:hypothetical protein